LRTLFKYRKHEQPENNVSSQLLLCQPTALPQCSKPVTAIVVNKSVIFPKLPHLGNWNWQNSTGQPRQAYSIERYQQE